MKTGGQWPRKEARHEVFKCLVRFGSWSIRVQLVTPSSRYHLTSLPFSTFRTPNLSFISSLYKNDEAKDTATMNSPTIEGSFDDMVALATVETYGEIRYMIPA